MTTIVSRTVSFLVGQVTFLSSSKTSLVNVGTGKVFLSMEYCNIHLTRHENQILVILFFMRMILLIFFLASIIYLLTANSLALELSSPRFKIEVEKPNIDISKDKLIVYTIQSLQGPQAFAKFKAKSYLLNSFGQDKDLIFSLYPSVINFADRAKNQTSQEEMELSVSTSEELDYWVNFIQEYPLKNLSGETIDLTYSLDSSHFRPLPNQNSGDSPGVILTKSAGSSEGKTKIIFKLDPQPDKPEGTYETIVDFVAIPSY